MTGRETPDAVRLLLDEAGVADDPALVRAVETIRTLGAGPAPEVTAELAQLMADGGRAPSGRRNKRRITFIGGALAVSMGVGMSGVAAGTALTDGLAEAVESMARFSIRDSADRAHPLPGAPAGPDDGGGPVVAPSAEAPARSLAEPVPAPSAAAEVGRSADAGPSVADAGPSADHAVPRGPAGPGPSGPEHTPPGAAPDAPAAAGPPAAVPPARQAPPAGTPAAEAPPAAVPPAAASPVGPAGSAPAPGRERRSQTAPGSPAPGSTVPGGRAPGTAVPGNGQAGGPAAGNGKPVDPATGEGKGIGPAPGQGKADGSVPGTGTAGGPVPGNGTAKAGGRGPEVRQLKQAAPGAPAGPAAAPRGSGPSADGRAVPAPQGWAWLLAPAAGPGQVPSAPVTGDPDRLYPWEPGAEEATFVPGPVPASDDPAGLPGLR
ncbi:hypothetical protein [Arthrobacter antioxidans]|uniref:hypothetical protein n=1 Tax=Arthrobacter antioxidans TaxID=2895818 RepID=UPI001FFF2DE5|nr:hypothetical protein [Arthrobacter antioxidans]